MKAAGLAVCGMLLLSGTISALAADSEAAFKAAYADAEAASQRAIEIKNQWTPTERALKDAGNAAQAGDYAQATALARQAEALANASLMQWKRESTAWTAAEIR